MEHLPPRLTRRTALGAATAFGIPYFVPAQAFGANERIVVGNIGVGGHGRSHVPRDESQLAVCGALCDVDANQLAEARKLVTVARPHMCKDFRELLDRKDIDAVTIATPDHWHAIQAVMACQAGKEVYSEKPMCRTIQEGHAMINAARHYQRVMQIGAQGRSNLNAWSATNFVRNGQLGPVRHVEFWHELNWSRPADQFAQDSPPPAELDWDLWLGPARWRPYNRDLVHFNFRWVMDFGGGFVRDRGQHGLSIVFWCMGMDGVKPESITVEASGEPAKESVWDAPVTMECKWEFKGATGSVGAPDWTLTWSQPGARHPFPHDPQKRPIAWGAKYHGDRDTLIVSGGDGGCDTEPKAKEFPTPAGGFNPLKLDSPIVDATARHRENWYRCIKSRELCVTGPEAMFNVITLPIIANIAYQLGRKLTWNPKDQRFVDDEEANRFLGEPFRAPWHL